MNKNKSFLGNLIYRKCLIIGIIIVLLFESIMLTSCGKKAGNKGADDNGSYLYSVKNVSVQGTDGLNGFKLIHVGEYSVLYGVNTDNYTSSNVLHVYYLNDDSTIKDRIDINLGTSSFVDLTLDEEGNTYSLLVSEVVDDVKDSDESDDTSDMAVGDYEGDSLMNSIHKNDTFLDERLGGGLFDKRLQELLEEKEKRAKESEAFLESLKKKNSDSEEAVSDEFISAEGDFVSEEAYADGLDNAGEDVNIDDFNVDDLGEAADESVMDDESMMDESMMDDSMIDESMMGMDDTEMQKGITAVLNPETADDQFASGFQGGGTSINDLSKNSLEIVKISKNAEILCDAILDDNANIKEAFEEIITDQKYLYVEYLVYDKGNLYVLADSLLISLNDDLNYKKITDSSKSDKRFKDIRSVFRNNSGNVYCYIADSTNNYQISVAPIDLEQGKIGDGMEVEGAQYSMNIAAGTVCDFTVLKGSLVYGYDYKGKEMTKLVDLTASDIATDNVSSVAGIDNNHFYGVYTSLEDGKTYCGYFSKSDGKQSVDKIELTFVVVESDQDVKRIVSKFNKENEKYRIRLIDYNALYGNNDFFADDTVIEKLNTDIIAGNMPDLLLLTSSMPVQTYINKGLLADIKPFIENDSEYSLDQFNSAVFNAYSNGDKMYRLVPSYAIQTLEVKKSSLDGKTSWTIGEALDLYKKSGAIAFMDPGVTKNDVINQCMTLSGSEFVDMENGKCSFNDASFKELLEFSNSFAAKYDSNNPIVKKMDTVDYYKRYKQSYIFANMNYYYSVVSYLRSYRSLFDNDMESIGFPTNGGNGNAFVTRTQFAMSNISENKDGCWEFLRYFLSESYQDEISEMFPIRNTSLDKCFEQAKEDPVCEVYYYNGQQYKYELTYYEDGEEKKVEPITDDEIAAFKDFINNIENTSDVDKKILSIVKEETDEYFNGISTVDQTINNIQSRVQIYIYETQ